MQDKIGKGSIGQVNPQKYEFFWWDDCYRGDNRVLGHRNNIPMLAFAVPPGCAPTRWHIPETRTPALPSQTSEWPTSPAAAPNAAKLHCEERRNNPPATFIALPETGWGKSFKSLSKIQTMLYLIFVGTCLTPISTPGDFLLSSTIIIYS